MRSRPHPRPATTRPRSEACTDAAGVAPDCIADSMGPDATPGDHRVMPEASISDVAPDAMAPLPRRALARRDLSVRAWLHEEQLDRALADGAGPWESSELLPRAAQLTSHERGDELAESIDALIELAARAVRLPATVPIARRAVLAEHDGLSEVAVRLRQPGPLGVAGVASVSRMLQVTLRSAGAPAGGRLHDAVVRCLEQLAPASAGDTWPSGRPDTPGG
jgi:hypothetical protein